MNHIQEPSHQDISLSLPIKMGFKALTNFLNTSFAGHSIGKTNSRGKEVNYFKIHHIDAEPSNLEGFDMELIVNLETLTTLYKHRELQISVYVSMKLDVSSQKIYIDAYKMDSEGQGWIADHLLKSVLNNFIYDRIINDLNIELRPLIDEKLVELNKKLAANFEINSGISILGAIQTVNISHFEIKNDTIWIIINIKGWGVIDVENLDL